jgi:hypothetical protein
LIEEGHIHPGKAPIEVNPGIASRFWLISIPSELGSYRHWELYSAIAVRVAEFQYFWREEKPDKLNE